MKKFIAILLTAIAVSFAIPAQAATPKLSRTVVFSTHLHCKNCANKVVENISYVKGVKDLKVSLEKQEISVTFDPSKTNVETLAAEIRKLGYPAQAKPAEIEIQQAKELPVKK